MASYYNEHDKNAAAWLRELIKAGMIAPGEVDERDMWDVIPADIMGFDQWHFCAGIGVWSYALRCAGWPDDRQILTISLPCQSFSAAGQGKGFADERGQLAEAFFWMLDQLGPVVCIGEQVEAALRHDWLDVMATQMEARGYTVGAVSSPACGYGAPHKRQRLYWVADLQRGGCGKEGKRRGLHSQISGAGTDVALPIEKRSPTRLVADAEHAERGAEYQEQRESHGRDGLGRHGNAGVLGDSEERGLRMRRGAPGGSGRAAQPGPTNGFWRNAEWIPCRDGKTRPTGRGIHPLVMADAESQRKRPGQSKRNCGSWIKLVGTEQGCDRCDNGETLREGGAIKSSFEQMADGPAAGMVHSGDPCAPADEIDPQNTPEARVMRLRGYGNSLCAPAAIEFCLAVKEILCTFPDN